MKAKPIRVETRLSRDREEIMFTEIWPGDVRRSYWLGWWRGLWQAWLYCWNQVPIEDKSER